MADEIMPMGSLPRLGDLHLRHPGLTAPQCRAWSDGAAVCLLRFHRPPTDLLVVSVIGRRLWRLVWRLPSGRAQRANANRDEATCSGAYSVALSAVEAELGLVSIGRACTGSGSDFLLQAPGTEPNLEEAIRLEVSGTSEGNEAALRARLKIKLFQLIRGGAQEAGYAAVVGFAERLVYLQKTGEARQP